VDKDERSTLPAKKYDFFHESTTPGLKDKAEKLLTVLAENPSPSKYDCSLACMERSPLVEIQTPTLEPGCK
jgi:hypothetical protein